MGVHCTRRVALNMGQLGSVEQLAHDVFSAWGTTDVSPADEQNGAYFSLRQRHRTIVKAS